MQVARPPPRARSSAPRWRRRRGRHAGPLPWRRARSGGHGPRRRRRRASTARLDAIVEHNAGDLTRRARARGLRRRAGDVRQGRQMLALDPPDGGATIGGVVSGGHRPAARSLRQPARPGGGHASGALDGTLAKSGGKVIKNVRLRHREAFTGSFGTLGAIVELSVRLHLLPPTPRQRLGESGPTSSRAAPPLAGSALEHHGLDVRWSGREGLARFGATASAGRGRRAAAPAEGLSTEILDDDDLGLGRAARCSADRSWKVSGLPTRLPALLRAADELGASLVAARRSGSCRFEEPSAAAVERLRGDWIARCRTGQPASMAPWGSRPGPPPR